MVYVLSEAASYMKLVTPWGNVHIENDRLVQVTVAIFLVVVSIIGMYRSFLRSSTTSISISTSSKAPKTQTDEVTSALQDNIIKKGENSYYYAHQPREHLDNESLQKTTVSSYGWSDQPSMVRIYLTDDVVTNMTKDQLHLNWTSTSLSMDLIVDADGNRAKSLVIPTLFHEINDVTWKVEGNQLTITLKKVEPLPWISLNAAAKQLEDHIEYDESLYD